MSSLTAALGRVIRAHRKRQGLSQEELAEKAGLHRTYVSLAERGQRSPSIATLELLANALDVPVSQLLADAEESIDESPPSSHPVHNRRPLEPHR